MAEHLGVQQMRWASWAEARDLHKVELVGM